MACLLGWKSLLIKGNLIHTSKNPHGWDWHDPRSRLKLSLHIVLAVFLVLLCAVIIVMLYMLFSGPDKSDVCTTATCVRASMELLQYVNPKADPCQDFYLFSCGNFLEATSLDRFGSKSVSGTAEEEIQAKIRRMLELPIRDEDRKAFNKAKQFYRACMNESMIEKFGLNGIRKIFNEIGGWPTISRDHWKGDRFTWQNAVHTLRALGVKADIFFKVTVDRSMKDEKEHVLGIHGDLYSPSQVNDTLRNMYLKYMVDIAKLFDANVNTARRDSNEVIDLLLTLAKIYEESAEKNKTGLHDVYNLSELQNKFPKISWRNYLNGILRSVQVRYDEIIVVSEPLYLAGVIDILEKTPKRTLANFISWFTLQHLIDYLPGKVIDRAYQFLADVNGKDLRKPRWSTCTRATQEKMDSVVSAAFIGHYFNENSTKDIEETIGNIKMQLAANLRRLSWLDDSSRALVTQHLLRNVEDIGSYNDIMEIHFENEAYDDVEIDENKLLQSLLNLDDTNLNIGYSKLHTFVKENWLGKTSFVTGIYVDYIANKNIMKTVRLVIPEIWLASILSWPSEFPRGLFTSFYYQYDRPKYMNYGAVGTIIAHEISHVLMKARNSDQPGDMRSQWSIDSIVRYGEKAKCLKDQYGAFEMGELNLKLNAQKTEDEDVADVAGVKIAYDAYYNWVQDHGTEPLLPGLSYSPYQLFWISSAVRHCSKYSPVVLKMYYDNYEWSPPQFRVNGPLQNLDAFAMDFGCPAGSRMNPEKKCHIW